MRDRQRRVFYASKIRVLVWALLALGLLKPTWFYLSEGWYLGTAICVVWVLMAAAWAVSLATTPIVVIDGHRLKVVERMIFGRPAYLDLLKEQITGIRPVRDVGLEIMIGRLGSRKIAFKLLAKRDRETAKREITRFVEE